MKKKSSFTNQNRRKIKKSAFTLIELLAVIIILGVLMIISIPSVTEYIQSSRKTAYVMTANQYVGGARNKVNLAEIPMYDIDTTYYLPASCISVEKGGNSPFGDWKEAYVVVTYDGYGYDYYWTSRDSSNIGVLLTNENKLEIGRVYTGVSSLSQTVGVGTRSKILLIGDSCSVYDATSLESTFNIEEGGVLEENVADSDINATISSCFDFDSSTGMITSYHQSDENCPTDVIIPEKINDVPVRVIGEKAFVTFESCQSNCNTQKSMTVSASYTVFPVVSSCGTYCTYSGNATSVNFSKASYLERIENEAFANNNLTSVNFGFLKNLKYIGESSFGYNKIELLNLGTLPNLEYIGSGAFSDNSIVILNLKNLNNVTVIGSSAFANNDISSVDFSSLKMLTNITSGLFEGNKLKSVDLSNLPNIQTIQSGAFTSDVLTSINISNLDGLTSISSHLCWECPLTNIIIKNNPKLTSIGEYAFFSNSYYNTNLVLENLPSLTIIGKSAFSHKRIDTLNLNKLPSYTVVGDYAFYELSMNTLIIGDYVTSIGSSSFARTNIKELVIPDNVVSIGTSAFYQNSLITITLGSGITSIGNKAFGMGGPNTGNSNYQLSNIYNNTGKIFNWSDILSVGSSYEFEIGTIPYGNRTVTITTNK